MVFMWIRIAHMMPIFPLSRGIVKKIHFISLKLSNCHGHEHDHNYDAGAIQRTKRVYASAAAAAAGAGAATSGFDSLDTRKLLRAMLSSVLQLLHLSFAETLNPSTPSTFPKSTTLSASQLGQGPEATKGFWKKTFSAKNLEPNCEKKRGQTSNNNQISQNKTRARKHHHSSQDKSREKQSFQRHH